MKSLMSLFHALLLDCGRVVGVDTDRDWKTVSRRFEHEGVSFIAITLSSYRNHFELSLADGRWLSGLDGFTHKSGLPVFLRGFLQHVFDSDAVLLESPDIDAIRCIRQLTGFAAKIKLPTTLERDNAAIEGYLQCENELATWEDNILPSLDLSLFDRISALLFRDIFSSLDRKVWLGDILPKHGSGSTADSLRGNQKYYQREWPSRLNEVFPLWDFLIPNGRFSEELEYVEFVEPGAERPVKVVLVPKTLKTPRVIAMEPTAMQYIQQGLLEAFVESIDSDYTLRSLISWSSQEPNQLLAKLGSQTGTLATLDLSEASDRVSLELVKRLLRNHPWLLKAVMACRSTRSVLPDGRVVTLRKFASMGSALCFPFEAMIFVVIVLCGMAKSQDAKHVSPRWISNQVGKVRVYGDDIICPGDDAVSVTHSLETFGLKVNTRKSFWTGRFRESCGKEYYDGVDVGYVKLRSQIPCSRLDVEELVSIVSTRNQFYELGYDGTVEYLDRIIRGLIPFPINGTNSSGLTRRSWGPSVSQRHDPLLHTGMVKAAVVKTVIPRNEVDGVAALMKFFLKRSEDPFEDVDHLLRSGRPKDVSLIFKWIPVVD